MPRFIGGYVDRLHNPTAFQELYEFNVIAPTGADYDPSAVLPAVVTPELDESHIAEELARSFGAGKPGDVVDLVLFEVLHDGTVQSFPLPVHVQFSSRNRGPEYIQIGMNDLERHFDWALERISREKILTLVRLPDSDRDCLEEDDEDSLPDSEASD